MKKRLSLFPFLLLTGLGHAAGQSATPVSPPAEPLVSPAAESFFGRFGVRFSLHSWAGFDSNVLRLSRGGSDGFGEVFPSLSLVYPFSASTSLSATYRLGLNRFSSTSFLNATSHRAGLELFHRLSPGWSVRVSDTFVKSDQPDVLTTPLLSFASYTQNAETLRLTRTVGTTAEYSFEYASHQRSYSRRYLTPSERQRDVQHALAFEAWRRAGSRTTLGLRAEYRWNLSNNPAYRYREPALSGFFTKALPHGFRVEVVERLTLLDFSQRTVSNDPSKRRSDFITTTMLGVRKSLLDDVDAIGRYYYEKDFSTEPRRTFSDHRFVVGLQISVGKASRPPRAVAAAPVGSGATAAEIVNRGYQALMKQDYSSALELSLQALALDPSLAEAHTNAGIAYYKMGKHREAVAQWRQTVALQPDNARVQRLLKEAGPYE